MIVCDAEHLGLIDATRRAQRLRPPAAELRGRPRGRGDRRRAAARGLHPRPLGRAPRPRGRGAGVLRGAPGGDPREGVLACAFHPELTDDPRMHALFMAMTTTARRDARQRGGGDVRDPRAENLAKILVGYSTKVKEGEVGLDRRRERRRAAAARGLRGGAEGRRPTRSSTSPSTASPPPTSSTPATPSSTGSRRSPEWMVDNADVRIAIGASTNTRELSGGPAGAPDPAPDGDRRADERGR